MEDILKIVRPPKREVDFFGENHELKRLTYGDVIDLIGVLSGLQGMEEGTPSMEKIIECRPALDILLVRSFPTFNDWGDVPVSAVPGLLGVIWEANNITKVIANFTQLAGRLPKQEPSTKPTSPVS